MPQSERRAEMRSDDRAKAACITSEVEHVALYLNSNGNSNSLNMRASRVDLLKMAPD